MGKTFVSCFFDSECMCIDARDGRRAWSAAVWNSAAADFGHSSVDGRDQQQTETDAGWLRPASAVHSTFRPCYQRASSSVCVFVCLFVWLSVSLLHACPFFQSFLALNCMPWLDLCVKCCVSDMTDIYSCGELYWMGKIHTVTSFPRTIKPLCLHEVWWVDSQKNH